MSAEAALNTFDTEFRSRLASGLVVSVLVHLGAGIALIGRSTELSGSVGITDALSPPEPEIPRVRPGVSQSRAVTINWLGFESPTEHQASPAETEQAALSPDQPGAPGVVDPVAPSPVEPASTEVAAATPEEVPAPNPSPDQSPEASSTPAAPAPAAIPEIAQAPASEPRESVAPMLPAAEAVMDEAGALASQLVQIVRRTIAEASEAEARAMPPGEESEDAEPSEKESPATSLAPAQWSPGRPIAAEGLDITPVHPRWNISTRLAAMPRNPVLRLDFGKDGRVKKAEFLEGRSTGYRDVDGPLLDAIYRWTAKGEALDKLPQGDPEAIVSIPIEIVLVRPRGPIERGSADR